MSTLNMIYDPATGQYRDATGDQALQMANNQIDPMMFAQSGSGGGASEGWGSFNPTYLQNGWNPAQYADDATSNQLAGLLGGTVAHTKTDPNPGGAFAVPSQNMIDLGGQDAMNAGLLSQRYSNQTMPQWQKDAMTQDELKMMGPHTNTASDNITYTGRTPPTTLSPMASQAFGTGGSGAAPASPFAPSTTSQGTASGPSGNPGSGSSGFNWGSLGGGSSLSGPAQGGSNFNPFANNTSPSSGGGSMFGGFGTGGTGGGGSTFGQPSFGQSQQQAFPQSQSNIQQYIANLSQGMDPLKSMAANGGGLASNNAFGGWTPYQVGALPQVTGNPGASLDGYKPYQVGALPGQALNGDAAYYRGLVQSGGSPIDQMPAWEAMKAAQQRNIEQKGADLAEQYNVSGNRFSTAFGSGMADYQEQAGKDQNALLAQMTAQALEAAKGRQYSGAQNLSNSDYQQQQYANQNELANRGLGLQSSQLDLNARTTQAQLAYQDRQNQTQNELANRGLGLQGSAQDLSARSMQAQLAQQAQDNQWNRQAQAAGQLGNFAFQGPMQLAQNEFNSGMQSQQFSQQAAMQQQQIAAQYGLAQQGIYGQGALAAQGYGFQSDQLAQQQAFQAAMYGAQGADSAAGQLAGYGAQGGNQLLNNAMLGAQGLYGAENNAAGALFNGSNTAAGTMYNGQMQGLSQQQAYDQALRQLGLSGAGQLSNQWNQSLALGSQLGQQQLGVDATNLDRVYQEWLRTQPQNNPFLAYLNGAALGQPTTYAPSYQPSTFNQIAGAVGNIGAGVGAVLGGRK